MNPRPDCLVSARSSTGNVVGKSDVNLAVANHAIAAVLEAGEPEAFDAHLLPQQDFSIRPEPDI
jgi:hypothetical protein